VNAPADPKVFGLGLSRTGTSSLAKALNVLGIRTKHYPADDTTFAELRRGQFRLSILERREALVDISVASYYAQFDQLYPGSKFILTVRDVGAWLHSVRNLFEAWRDRDPHRQFTDFIWAVVYGTHAFNEDRFRYVYETHVRNVSEFFEDRPDDLLIMDITAGDGWSELCPFLGRSVPASAFPHRNSEQDMRRWAQQVATELVEGVESSESGAGRRR
jgi:hypothetical protein